MAKEKIVIFGLNDAAMRFLMRHWNEVELLAFIDEKITLVGTGMTIQVPGGGNINIPVRSIYDLKKLAFDKIYLSSMVLAQNDVNQLVAIGVEQNKISTRILEEERILEAQRMQFAFDNDRNEPIKDIDLYLGAYKKEEYELNWQKIKSKYKSVRLFRLRMPQIGETLSRYLPIKKNEIEVSEPDVLKVFLPQMIGWNRICNRELIKLLSSKLYIPQYDEMLFWSYVYRYHFNELDASQINKYLLRDRLPIYEVEPYKHDFTFSKQQVAFAEQQMLAMNLKSDFVCFASRNANYNLKTIGTDLKAGHRNMDFADYTRAIHYLGESNIQTVRMGREEVEISPIDNCVDYAGKYANDFMDLFIVANCKFFVTSSSGIFALAFLFGRPLLMVNVVPMSLGMGGIGYTKYDLYIPKKYYDVNRKRFLSLREMIITDRFALVGKGIQVNRYSEAGIQLINNTPEEIQEATAELLGRLNGTWHDDELDRQNHEKYNQVFKDILRFSTEHQLYLGGGAPFPYRLAATYLRKNPYLLE